MLWPSLYTCKATRLRQKKGNFISNEKGIQEYGNLMNRSKTTLWFLIISTYLMFYSHVEFQMNVKFNGFPY